MNELRDPGDAVIAIVGGGASGVLVALQLLRQAVAPVQIVVIEPHAVLGEAWPTPPRGRNICSMCPPRG